jgi:hypothetical protein
MGGVSCFVADQTSTARSALHSNNDSMPLFQSVARHHQQTQLTKVNTAKLPIRIDYEF